MNRKTLTHLADIQGLVALITKICELIGLKNVHTIDEYVISATEESILGNRSYKIICTLSELSGKVQLISELIKGNSTSDDYIIIISSHKKKISNYFKEWIKKELNTDKLEFWEESFIIDLINKHMPEYWGHNDLFLKTFEDAFLKSIGNDAELQQVLKLDKKFEELLNIFIEPKIFRFKEDKNTNRILKVKFKLDQYLDGDNYFISGDAGTGKTTLLKEIGKLVILKNSDSVDKKLPIRIKTSLIASSEYSITKSVEKEVKALIGEDNLDKVFKDYKVILLIDSIDEFEDEKQQNVFTELNQLSENENISFIVATRNYESLTKGSNICKHNHTILSNFDLHQVKQYLTTFFKRDLKKSEDLWESLLDNKILERVPVTALTISLVSILYEENGYEVPATITDVYDNFNTFLLGRLSINTNLDFLKINVKEKILSMYALEIIQTPNRSRKKREEFIEYIVNYFKGQSITIEEEVIPELVKGMTDGTGVLYIDEQGYVTYQHDHFMEYYASREIFNQENRAELEKEIIEKFTEYNWQNTAIFYTGRTKDMKNFLDNLVERVYRYKLLPEHLLAISGLGYVLQSLWMTNSQNRKSAVIAALDLLIKADTGVKLLAEQKFPFFNGIKDTDIALAHLSWFYLHFNSVTLRDPLQLAFDDLHKSLKELDNSIFESNKVTRLYQLFCIAATLNTGRVKDTSKLEILFDEDKLLNIPLFVYLFDEAFEALEFSNESKLRRMYKLDSKKKRYNRSIRFYLDNTSEDLRYTTFENFNPIKNVELYTEGKTDASILSHAYRVLTMGDDPYWNITATENIQGSKAGGAQQLAAHLKKVSEQIETDFDKKKIVIGIFDNDEKGFQEYNGLSKNFVPINGILKKANEVNVFALLLPIPINETYSSYHQEKQTFKFFEIEHYFSHDLLESQRMINETSIPGVFEITGDKAKFNEHILKLEKAKHFENFIYLFSEIDLICNNAVNYIS